MTGHRNDHREHRNVYLSYGAHDTTSNMDFVDRPSIERWVDLNKRDQTSRAWSLSRCLLWNPAILFQRISTSIPID